MNNNPLQDLIVDPESLDKEKLASLIRDNLGISKDGEVVILSGFNNLSIKSKILSILLAKKAAKVMAIIEDEQMAPKEISQKTGLPSGTVGRELLELKNIQRLISKDKGYFVPDYAVHQIVIETNITKRSAASERTIKKVRKINGQKSTNEISEKTKKLLQIKQESIKKELIDLMLKPGLTLERSLAVLKIARDNGINDLNPAEIESFLKNKIRAGGIWRTNISLYLGKKGARYVDRFPDPIGTGFTYRIMVPGEQLLEEVLEKEFTNSPIIKENVSANKKEIK